MHLTKTWRGFANLDVQAADGIAYGLAMMRNDSRQGSLFLDGDLPSVERGRVAGHGRDIPDPPADAPGDDVHMRIQRHPATKGLFRSWWRRLVGVR
ncbi:hypothetical protein RLDS_06470 [Sphingobium lactosutens DS20]|uniref:Uncharacterized protein n=1 Tax=Sphingobium lactosutens DS20 TaxID=1331060 RepID=T0HUH0_9SPHN|nr:hypothetical protein RLDS_06470 [Sphingobium lactosutens DS20]